MIIDINVMIITTMIMIFNITIVLFIVIIIIFIINTLYINTYSYRLICQSVLLYGFISIIIFFYCSFNV